MSATNPRPWKEKLHEIIYEADTPLGKLFNLALLSLILLSIVLVMLESVKPVDKIYHDILYFGEWAITAFFTLEYIARVITVKKPGRYVFSFFGIIDLLSTLPLYLSFFFPGSSSFLALRAVRLLRVYRILKISRYVGEANKLKDALLHSRVKIFVFLFAVIVIAVISGTMMYLIEGGENGFRNIPVSVYWCIVTLTTVGFGDISPVTPLGQFLASVLMILGYGIIAVPTGIVSAEYSKRSSERYVHVNTQVCRNCGEDKHKDNSKFCDNCGEPLHASDVKEKQ